MRSKEESHWAVDVLRKVGEKLTAQEVDAGDKLRRRSSIKESFTSFGDVVLAAQMASDSTRLAVQSCGKRKAEERRC